MNDVEINDKRTQSDFRGVSFSKFQKSKVKNTLLQCLISSKVEPACYWSAELICSGHFSDLWEILILFFSRYIHIGNPKLPIYIALRFSHFKDVLSNGYLDNEIRMRNNIKVRKIFAEIIGTLCHSHRKHNFEPIKIKKEEEFNMSCMATRLKAPSVTYATPIFKTGDPKELYIAINEFTYHISSESRNVVQACYWLEWVLEYDFMCKRKKEKSICEHRTFAPVLCKYQVDTIWLIWDSILYVCDKKDNPLIKKIILALLEIFSIKFSSGIKKRRRFIIYFAIALLIEDVNFDIEMINNRKEIDSIVKKISIVYKDVKKNEVSPQTDYLFTGTATPKRSALDKTIERLDKMNKIMHEDAKESGARESGSRELCDNELYSDDDYQDGDL